MPSPSSRAAAGLLAGMLLLGANAAGAESSATFSNLKSTASGSDLVVSGRASFTADPVRIATDPATDGRPGAELVGASIGFAGQSDIEFTVELGGAVPQTAPAVASIEWVIDVNSKGRATTLTAVNSSAAGLGAPTPGSYSFEFWDCTDDNLGCVVTDLTGKASGNTVTFIVPRATLGVSAGGGDRIDSARIAVQPIIATPAATGKPAGADLDSMAGTRYTVPTTQVQVTVGSQVRTASTTGTNGSFTTTFPGTPATSSATINALLDGVVVGTGTP